MPYLVNHGTAEMAVLEVINMKDGLRCLIKHCMLHSSR